MLSLKAKTNKSTATTTKDKQENFAINIKHSRWISCKLVNTRHDATFVSLELVAYCSSIFIFDFQQALTLCSKADFPALMRKQITNFNIWILTTLIFLTVLLDMFPCHVSTTKESGLITPDIQLKVIKKRR